MAFNYRVKWMCSVFKIQDTHVFFWKRKAKVVQNKCLKLRSRKLIEINEDLHVYITRAIFYLQKWTQDDYL